LRRLKASKLFLHANSNALYNYRHFAAFSVDSVHLKKPSGGPKGLIGPPCHGAPGRRRHKNYSLKREGLADSRGGNNVETAFLEFIKTINLIIQ
jgi:hypothetical protein